MSELTMDFETHVHGDARRFRRYSGMARPDGVVVDSSGYPRDPYQHCAYCGSLPVAAVLDLLNTPGVRWSMADWKYGGPHKFYVDVPHPPFQAKIGSESKLGADGSRIESPIMGEHTTWHLKFYTEHLAEAEDDQLARWNAMMGDRCGVRFARQHGRLMWNAPDGVRCWWGTVESAAL